MDHRRVGVERQPAVEPARLPVAAAGAAPARGMRSAPARARQRAGRAGPERRRRRSRRLRRSAGTRRCVTGVASISNGASAHRQRRQLVVEREAAAPSARGRVRASPPAIRERLAPRQRPAAASAGRRRPAERRAQPGERLAVHVLVEQREAVEVVRGVVVAVARDRVEAGVELRRRGVAASSARDGSGARPALGVGEPRRVEDRVGPGDARRLARRATKPSASSACGPRRIQNSANQARWPSSQATGLTPGCCGTRQCVVVEVDRPAQRRRARLSRSAAASAAPARRRASAAIGLPRAACHASFDGCIDRARAAGPASSRRRWPRPTTATGTRRRAGSASSRRWPRSRSAARPTARRDGRPADRPACAPLGRRDRALARRRGRTRRSALVLTGTDLYRDLDA